MSIFDWADWVDPTTSEGRLTEAAWIAAELPMSDDGTGHVADCGYSENGPPCGCYTLPARLAEYVAARTHAAEQERDRCHVAELKRMVQRAEAAEQERDEERARAERMRDDARLHANQRADWQVRAQDAEDYSRNLAAKVLALAEEWDDPDPERGDPDRADELRALVSDPAALDRVRQEAAKAALAPIEALAERLAYADCPTWVVDALHDALPARDAAGRSGSEG